MRNNYFLVIANLSIFDFKISRPLSYLLLWVKPVRIAFSFKQVDNLGLTLAGAGHEKRVKMMILPPQFQKIPFCPSLGRFAGSLMDAFFAYCLFFFSFQLHGV